MTELTRAMFAPLQAQIEALREVGEDYLILSVGVHGPTIENHLGGAVATVRMGIDEATSEAVHLVDAILLARGKILDQRKAREKAREEERAAKAKAKAQPDG